MVAEAIDSLLPVMTRLARLHVRSDADVATVVENDLLGLQLTDAEFGGCSSEPRAGRRGWAWPRCRCPVVRTATRSSRSSPGTTGTSWITSARRCSPAYRRTYVRQFLLETLVLDRLSRPLCNAVTGRDDAAVLRSGWSCRGR
jgi:hypothetical protein